MRLLSIALLAALCTTATANAEEFTIDFTWEGLSRCNSGNPKTVSNPAFAVKGLPPGTQVVEFRLTDRQAPSYNHGGGAVKMSQSGTVPPGIFKYKSPCPPGGQHTYVWTATAKDKAGFGGKKLGAAQASRKYPE